MVLGDRSVALVANGILGEMGAKLVLLFVLISVMGTVNGLVLGFIRMPYSMAIQGGMLPGSQWLAKEHAATRMPRNSAWLALGLSLFWIFAHYLTHKYQLLQNSDVSEISIAVNYLLYIALYYQVFKMYRAGEIRGALRGICIPLFATIGSVFVLLGSMQDPQFVYYAAFGLAVIGAALLYAGRSGR